MRNSTPWIAAFATLVLCAGFWLPIGTERLGRTTYQAFQGLAASFGPPPVAPVSAATPAPQPLGGTTLPGASSEQVAAQRESRPGSPRKLPISVRAGKRKARAGSSVAKRPSLPSYPEPTDSPAAASPIEGVPRPAPAPPAPPPADFSADAVHDAFDSCDSKFPLDASSAKAGVTLRLLGLCRWQGHYIVKVAVTNESEADFFVKELSAYEGRSFLSLKSYFRLLVEPGRTRDGFALFDARPGAQVNIALKEDRENGRSLQASVRYPF